jgi:4-hydroxybenzoate polyprenyltransferase
MKIADWVEALRPRHWVKSGFCFSAVFFSGNAREFGAWWQVLPVAIAFSVLASAGYLLNDVINRREDCFHPRKKRRAVASGRVTPRAALVVSGILMIAGMASVVRVYGSGPVLVSTGCYVVVTVLYSLLIRNVPVLDVLVLAWGFVLRVISGAFALSLVFPDVKPTVWLVVCTYALALLLGFGKRRAELLVLKAAGERIGSTRGALRGYSPRRLDVLVGVSALLSGASYVTYCIMRESPVFLVTIVPVVVGLMSYLRMAGRSAEVETPEDLILHNAILFSCVGIWLVLVALL